MVLSGLDLKLSREPAEPEALLGELPDGAVFLFAEDPDDPYIPEGQIGSQVWCINAVTGAADWRFRDHAVRRLPAWQGVVVTAKDDRR